jgi:hypothetical protein
MSLFDGNRVNIAPETTNGQDAIVLGVAAGGPRAYAEVDVCSFPPGEVRDLAVLRNKVLASQPNGFPCHAAMLLAPRYPAFDEPEFNQFVGQEERREELLKLPTGFLS